MNIQSNQKAIFAAFFCNFFWGLSFLASRIALNEALVSVLRVDIGGDIWGAEIRRSEPALSWYSITEYHDIHYSHL